MEMAKDLNMESDEMQLVVSALRGVKKKLWKWQRRTSRSFPENFSLQVRKCASGCISVPVPCRTIGTERLSPTRSLLARYSIRLRIWKRCWKLTIKIKTVDILLKRKWHLEQREVCFKCRFFLCLNARVFTLLGLFCNIYSIFAIMNSSNCLTYSNKDAMLLQRDICFSVTFNALSLAGSNNLPTHTYT